MKLKINADSPMRVVNIEHQTREEFRMALEHLSFEMRVSRLPAKVARELLDKFPHVAKVDVTADVEVHDPEPENGLPDGWVEVHSVELFDVNHPTEALTLTLDLSGDAETELLELARSRA